MALKDNLVSVWELNEASGTALDSFGANTLTEVNGPIAATTGPPSLTGARDIEADSAQYFTLADNTAVSTGDIDFTFGVWVKFESLAVTRVIFRKDLNDGVTREYGMYYGTSGGNGIRFYVFTGTGGAGFKEVKWTVTPTLATWYHVFGWHDSVGNVIGITLNANATPVTLAHSGGVFDGTAPLTVGGIQHDGPLAQLAMWKRVVGSTDRDTIYAAGNGLPYSSWDAGVPTVKPWLYHRFMAE